MSGVLEFEAAVSDPNADELEVAAALRMWALEVGMNYRDVDPTQVRGEVGALQEELAERLIHIADQYCLVKRRSIPLSTFPQRHAREFVDDLLIRLPCFHFPCCTDIFSLWAKPGLVLQRYQVRV